MGMKDGRSVSGATGWVHVVDKINSARFGEISSYLITRMWG